MAGARAGHIPTVAVPATTPEGEREIEARDRSLAEGAPLRGPTGGRPLEFRELYDTHFAFVWRTARRLGVHDALLDDAVQDVFVVIHRRLEAFEGRSPLRSWIFGITRRVAKDYRRRAARKDRGKVATDRLTASGPGPAQQAERSEAMSLLYEMLAGLDEAKREVFILAEIEEMTVPEIAAALDTNVNTIYSRLRAARAAFERQVARHRARERNQTDV
jgi:RNA polymerase sigma-70 factor (ECF subfamily)